MELIHDRLLNNQFAPGIATYGIDGKNGKAGQPGSSFYFTSYSLEDKTQQDNAIVKINRSMILSEFVDLPLGRDYEIGDLIIDSVGKIYRLVQKNGQFAFDYVTDIVGMTDNEFFKSSGNNRLYLTSSHKDSMDRDVSIAGLDIVQGLEDNQDGDFQASDFALRVINTKEDSKSGKFNILQLLSKPVLGKQSSLNISYDTNSDAFTIDSESKIFIDADKVEVKRSSNDGLQTFGEFYRISPYNDPIGLVHMIFNEAKWTYDTSQSKLTISGIKANYLSADYISSTGFSVKVTKDGSTKIFTDGVNISEDGKVQISVASSMIDASKTIVSVIKGIEVYITKGQ